MKCRSVLFVLKLESRTRLHATDVTSISVMSAPKMVVTILVSNVRNLSTQSTPQNCNNVSSNALALGATSERNMVSSNSWFIFILPWRRCSVYLGVTRSWIMNSLKIMWPSISKRTLTFQKYAVRFLWNAKFATRKLPAEKSQLMIAIWGSKCRARWTPFLGTVIF